MKLAILAAAAAVSALVTACSDPPKPRTPDEVAKWNLFKEQVKNKRDSETWTGHRCSMPEPNSPEISVCVVQVFDQMGSLVSTHYRTYRCSTKMDSFCVRQD